MSTKKIWVSRDNPDTVHCLYHDVWRSEPYNLQGVYTVAKINENHILSVEFNVARDIFGQLEPGQCKCFEIKEIKP